MIPIILTALGSAWSRMLSGLASLWGWAVRNPAWAITAVALAVAAWALHARADALKQVPMWRNAFAGEQAAYRQQTANLATVRAGLTTCNASVIALQRASDARQQAAQAAARASERQDAGNAAKSAQIIKDAPDGLPAASCPTPPDVMAARGGL